MDKLIIIVGMIIVTLGVGFIVAGSIYQNLHEVYGISGLVWLIVGVITTGFGIRVRREKIKNLEAMR